MKTLTISVTEELATLLEEAVATGKYASDSDMIAAALTLLEKQEALRHEEIEWMRREVQAGLDSGPPVAIDFDAFLSELKAKRSRRG